jgi:hypothetical protein
MQRLRPFLPWFSLAFGVFSAVTMDRSPRRAWLVALAAGGGWLLLGACALVERVDGARLGRFGALLVKALRGSTFFAAQSLMQLCFFFALPFFVQATAVPAHWPFVALLIAASLLTLWDPLHAASVRHPLAGAALQAFATFVALDCVLPILGFSNRSGLLLAAAGTAIGLPLAAALGSEARQQRRRRALRGLGVGVALMVVLALGGARLVPPAPLRLTQAAIDASTAAQELRCETAIAAPRGLRETLRHVWSHDGARRAEVELEVTGGRLRGFRTWSTKRAPEPGRWTCAVETELGQTLGAVEFIER